MQQIFKTKAHEDVLICTMQQADLDAADHVTRLAFGTFLGMPNPLQFMGDASFIHTRWKADPTAAFCAKMNDEIVGSVFAGNWGSVGFFGPLTIHPKMWDRGIAQYLMMPVMECFKTWGASHLGLFTFAQSIKHVSLYQKFGFYPRYLTALMSKPVHQRSENISWSGFSDAEKTDAGKTDAGKTDAGKTDAGKADAESLLNQCYKLTDSVFGGLDLTREIQSVSSQHLGETVLLWDKDKLVGMAICHCGPGTEAGSGTCYIKFGVVGFDIGVIGPGKSVIGPGKSVIGPAPSSSQHFKNLLIACEQLAAKKSLKKIVGGMNTARRQAYQLMLENGYKTDTQGVAMQQPDAGYNREDVFLIDDWR